MDPVTIVEIIQLLRRGSRKKGSLGMLGIKNLLALIGFVVVAFAGAGWYLGWYKIGEQTDAQGHPELKIQVDSSKVTNDLKNAEQRVFDSIDKTKAAVAPVAGQPPVSGPGLLPTVNIQVQEPTNMLPAPSPPQGGSWIIPPPKE
jgi:hypothetical protein